jgi:putative IMPACT (imprinted ancient) family translation regulator
MTITKEEILNRLKASRQINTMEVTDNWKAAFDLYNEARGTKMKAEHRCSKCYQMVLDFLQDVK